MSKVLSIQKPQSQPDQYDFLMTSKRGLQAPFFDAPEQFCRTAEFMINALDLLSCLAKRTKVLAF